MSSSKELGPIGTIVGATIGTIIAPGAGTVSGAAIGGGLGTATGQLLATAPKLPTPPPPTLMPDQSQIAKASQASLTDQLARRGRASTIMTGPSSSNLSGN